MNVTTDSWQMNLVWRALESGDITEEQAVLLLALYREANYATRVIEDFRAERVCGWLGKEPKYTRAMQQRLAALRDLGWFESGYRQGVKTPYDIRLKSDTHTACQGHGVRDTVTESVTLPAPESFLPVPILTLRVLDEEKAGARSTRCVCVPSMVSELRTRIYQRTEGEMLDSLLTPAQINSLLEKYTVDEVEYAVCSRRMQVTVQQTFHRSLKAFLLNDGVQVELDSEHCGLCVSNWGEHLPVHRHCRKQYLEVAKCSGKR